MLDFRAVLVAVLVMAVFGGSYTMVKVGLQDLPAFGSLLLRALVGMIVIGLYMRWTRLPFLHEARATWFLLAQAAAFVGQQSLLYLGMTYTSAARGAILFNVQPFFTLILLPFLIRAERLTARNLFGTIVGFAGVTLVLSERGGDAGSWVGDGLVLAGAALWSVNVVLNRAMPRDLHPVVVIFWSVAATVPVTAVLTTFWEADATWELTLSAVCSVLYLGIVVAAIGFSGFVWLTRTYSPALVNPFVFLAPVFGVVIAWMALEERITLVQAVGGAVVALGIWVVNTGKRQIDSLRRR